VLVPQLPGSLRAPVVIVQHMPAAFIGALVATLDRKGALRVVEGQHGMPIERGFVYVAPGERQMRLVGPRAQARLALTDDPPENHCRPAADYLFRSVAEVFGPAALGVVMTGMGADGTSGLRQMKAAGARVLAQDEESCVVFGMPMEAIKAGVVDRVVPLDRMAAEIARMVECGAA
jgi:two-component system chemotaxis response regulator CheB